MWDCTCRPFLRGQVAYSLASEVIGLLHGLVTVPGAAEVWSTAIKEVGLHNFKSAPNWFLLQLMNLSALPLFLPGSAEKPVLSP